MAYISTHSTLFEVSGSNSPSSYFDSRPYFILNYSQNSTTGQTTYTMDVYAQRYSADSEEATLSYNITAWIGGEGFTRSGSWTSSGSGYTLHYLFSVSKTVNSNSDGTGVQIAYTIQGQTYNAYKYGGTYYFTPPTVALQSTISNNTSDTSRIEFGNEVTFTINRSNSNYKHDLSYKIGDTTYTIGTDIDTSVNYTFPASLIGSFTNTDRPNITVECVTKNNGSQIGVTTNTVVYLLVPDSYVPTISLAVSDEGSTPSSWGIWVKTRSKIKGVITAAGIENSTIQSYSASANNQNYSTSEFTTDAISSSGSLTITASVKDSRNRTASTSQDITVIDYSKPTISSFEVKRCNADGTLNEDGTYAKAIVTYSVSSCETNNAKTLKVKDTTNSNEKEIPLTDYSGTVTSEVFSSIQVSAYYEFTATISDTFESITYLYKVSPSSKVVSMRAEKDGISFGQIATESGFNCYYDANFLGKLMKDGVEVESGNIPEIKNEYSESETDVYSCAYINNNNWVLLGIISTIGSSYALDIPTDAKELFIETFATSDSDGATIHILTSTLKSSNKGFDAGFYKSSSDMMRILIYSTNTKVWIQEVVHNGSMKSNVSSCYVYYK